jgi:hypothetical protein
LIWLPWLRQDEIAGVEAGDCSHACETSTKGRLMLPFQKSVAGWGAIASLAGLVAGCSSDVSISNINLLPRIETLAQQRLSYSAPNHDFELPPLTPADLIGPEGQCSTPGAEAASGVPNTADGGSTVGGAGPSQGGVALQMSECEVMRRAGIPEKFEIGTNERRERTVVLTYLQGPRPGIYNFAEGRLVSIERAPSQPAAVKPQKSPTKTVKKPAPV